MTAARTPENPRRTQADRRARSRHALLAAAVRGFSTYGYADLALEWVAGEAGYTRGALYHQFAGKEDLALAVVAWIDETWNAEVGVLVAAEADPVDALIALARGHARYCRRYGGRVLQTLRVEFAGRDHPVGRAITDTIDRLTADCTALIAAAARSGAIPAGPPPAVVAGAYLSVVEAVGIDLAGQAPHDVELAERAGRGVLGLPPVDPHTGMEIR